MIRRALKADHDPPLPLHRLRRSVATFTQEEITNAMRRTQPQLDDAKGLREIISTWRRAQVSAHLFRANLLFYAQMLLAASTNNVF